MSEPQSTTSAESMCEIIGCSSPATTTRWLIDEERHIQVCWKHADGEEEADRAET